MNGVPHGMPTTNIVSFKDENEIAEFSLDYSLMVEKFIRAKLQSVYDTLGWNLGEACGDATPKNMLKPKKQPGPGKAGSVDSKKMEEVDIDSL